MKCIVNAAFPVHVRYIVYDTIYGPTNSVGPGVEARAHLLDWMAGAGGT